MIVTLSFLVSLMGVLLSILVIEYFKARTAEIEKDSYDNFRKELKSIPVINRILESNIVKNKTKIDNPV
jgi:hypothetical protein